MRLIPYILLFIVLGLGVSLFLAGYGEKGMDAHDYIESVVDEVILEKDLCGDCDLGDAEFTGEHSFPYYLGDVEDLTSLTFEFPLGEEVTLSEDDLKSLSIEELKNLSLLLNLYEEMALFNDSVYRTWGETLLPRFFIKESIVND